MMIVSVNGGLGNQLFQYAFGRYLAHLHNTPVFFDLSAFDNPKRREYALNHFNTIVNKAKPTELPFHLRSGFKNFKPLPSLLNRTLYPYQIIEQQRFDFNPNYLINIKRAYYWGYWQSEKYFEGIKDIIKQELSFRQEFSSADEKLTQKIESHNSVCLHIRRGDYVGHKFHPVCEPSYYEKAISIISNQLQHPYFFIFSDDIAWCRENISIAYDHDFIDTGEAWRDLRLMTYCHHYIIANSTFSWWAAYLGKYVDKIVISPKHWFSVHSKHNTKDLIPKNWLSI